MQEFKLKSFDGTEIYCTKESGETDIIADRDGIKQIQTRLN